MVSFQKAYKVRLYPTTEQEDQLKQICGNCRWLWNYLLDANNEQYSIDNTFRFYYDMAALLPYIKDEFEWLALAPAQSLQRVAKNFDKALKDSFKEKNKKGFPKRKKKSNYSDSFYLSNQNLFIDIKNVTIPKFSAPIRYKFGTLPNNKIVSATISQSGNHWFMSIVYDMGELPEKITPDINTTTGIDLGLKTLITTSDGEIIENQKFLKYSQKEIKKLQRQLSKKTKGSNNRKKVQLKLANKHRKVRNQRIDYIHKLTSDLIANNSAICVEDLNTKGLLKNHNLAGAISDASWGEIVRQLTYKAEWYGKHLVKIGRFEPSTQTCSCCGHKQKMPLDKRTYDCPNCNMSMDRDVNAAINIKIWGFRRLVGQELPEPITTVINA